jgi:hypothetical protein
MLISVNEALSFLGIENEKFFINGNQNKLVLVIEGNSYTITLDNGYYDSDSLCSHLITQINAADTGINSSVSFVNSKLTISVTDDSEIELNIGYTHIGSTAGYLLGFTSDKDPALTLVADQAPETNSALVENVINLIDGFIKDSYCHNKIEAADYSEIYELDGRVIGLNHYPINSIKAINIGEITIFKVKYNNQYITSYIEFYDGVCYLRHGVNNEVALTLADYNTVTALVTAINAENNWKAEIINNNYADNTNPTTIPDTGALITSHGYVGIKIKSNEQYYCDINRNTGILELEDYIRDKVFITYNAGYAIIPEDIKTAAKILVQIIFEQIKSGTINADYIKRDKVVYKLTEDIPKYVKNVLDKYKKVLL